MQKRKVKQKVIIKGQHYWIKDPKTGKKKRIWKERKPYYRTITKYILNKKDLEQQFKQRSRKAQLKDLAQTSKTVFTTPIVSTQAFFDFRRADIKGIDTMRKNEKTNLSRKKIRITFRQESRTSGSAIKSRNRSYFIAVDPSGVKTPSWEMKAVSEGEKQGWVGTEGRHHLKQDLDFELLEGTIIKTRNKDYYVVDPNVDRGPIKSGRSTLSFRNEYLVGNLREIDTIMTEDGKYKHLKYIDYDRYKQYEKMSKEERMRDKKTAIVTEEQFKALTGKGKGT